MVSDARRLELLEEYFSSRIDREIDQYLTPDPSPQELLARERLKRGVETICHHYPEGAKILDLGSGSGLGAITLAELGFDVTAVEMIPALVEQARHKTEAPIEWLNEPFGRKTVKRGTFDVILSLGYLEYQERAGKELIKMKRALKPGGMLILSVPNTLSAEFSYGLTRAYFRLASEPEEIPIRHSFTPERLQRLLGMAGFILLDYNWLPEGEDDVPLSDDRDRDMWAHRVRFRTAPELISLSRTYRPEDTSVI